MPLYPGEWLYLAAGRRTVWHLGGVWRHVLHVIYSQPHSNQCRQVSPTTGVQRYQLCVFLFRWPLVTLQKPQQHGKLNNSTSSSKSNLPNFDPLVAAKTPNVFGWQMEYYNYNTLQVWPHKAHVCKFTWLCDNVSGLGEHVTCHMFWFLRGIFLKFILGVVQSRH